MIQDSDDSDEDVDHDRVDPARTEKILDNYLSSQSREDAFQACLEEVMEPGQEERPVRPVAGVHVPRERLGKHRLHRAKPVCAPELAIVP